MKICPACQSSYEDTLAHCPRDGSLLFKLLDAGTVVGRKYQIAGQIGRGGMGVVYRARHLHWNEDCAIKILLQPRGQAFLAEAQVMRRLQHPHIVRVEDADVTEDGQPFVVMEFIHGDDLKSRIRRAGPVDPEEALRITAEACAALDEAHRSGVIHRDIKPHNLLLARQPDGSEIVKVIDFGLAKVREEAGLGFSGVYESKTGIFAGTPEYASPEQALGVRGSQLDGRSDLYSLGLVLYEMLSGTLPFLADTPMGMLVQRLHADPAPLREVKPDLPQAACDVAMRALQRDRDSRYGSASEMKAACEQALATIRREREEALRREQQAREAQMAAEQRRLQREERRRRMVAGLRSAVRRPTPLWAAAIAAGILLALGLAAFVYFYYKYARVVDDQLRAGLAVTDANLFAAPETVSVGDFSTPADVASVLRGGGYNESRGNPVGYYQLQASAISIFPGSFSYFDAEPGVIKFAAGKISQIVSLQDNTPRSHYQLEPQIITNLGREKRRVVAFRDIPRVLAQAITAAEDKRFFQHGGFDPFGGPTITRKLVDLVWAPNGRWARAMITLQVEQKLSKEEIFEDYCNQVDFGTRGPFRIRGFGEAAATFLGKNLSQISLPEAAELAAIPASPDDLDPFRHPDSLRDRRNTLLGQMRSNGFIADRDYASAMQAPLTVGKGSMAQAGEAPYFADMVSELLQNRFPDENFQSNRFRIYTTLDLRLQRAAEDAVRLGMQKVDEQIRKQSRFQGQTPPMPQVAMIALDPHTGAVKALVGGRNYGADPNNRALANRQPGSLFKPFVYAAAMETAVTGGSRVLTPGTTIVDEPATFYFGGQAYEPRDSGQTYRGKVTIREALALSLNIPAVKVAEMVGYDKVVDMANRAGMNRQIRPDPGVALGIYDVTPLEISGAYTIFANGGAYVKPSVLALVRSSDGKVLYKDKPEQKRVVDPRVASLVTGMMEEVLRSGVAAGVKAAYGFRATAAAATGTSRDGWFAGYTSELLCVVWVGFDDGRDLELDGPGSAAPIWMEFMQRAPREYRDTKPFAPPDGNTPTNPSQPPASSSKEKNPLVDRLRRSGVFKK